MSATDQRNDAEIVCEGYPTQRGCPNSIEAGRTNWSVVGTKRNGWYVTPATEDTKGTVSVPLWLCYFCPSCAVIVKAQEAKAMTARDCPDCEQNKHAGCTETVLADDDIEVPCPCAAREHKAVASS